MDGKDFYKDIRTKVFTLDYHNELDYGMKSYHFHDYFELSLFLSGGGVIVLEDQLFKIHPGDIFLLNNLDLHKIKLSGKEVVERYIFHFWPSYIQDLSTGQTDLLECYLERRSDFSPQYHPSEEVFNEILALTRKIEDCFKHPDGYGQEIYKKLYLTEILLMVNSFARHSKPLLPSVEDKKYARIKPIMKYVYANLQKDLNLDFLSKEFAVSKYHLEHLFKESTGVSIRKYIITRRIMMARRLLEKNICVTEVCDQVGFNNLSHFIRTFKKIVGVPPKQYSKLRAEMKKSPEKLLGISPLHRD